MEKEEEANLGIVGYIGNSIQAGASMQRPIRPNTLDIFMTPGSAQQLNNLFDLQPHEDKLFDSFEKFLLNDQQSNDKKPEDKVSSQFSQVFNSSEERHLDVLAEVMDCASCDGEEILEPHWE